MKNSTKIAIIRGILLGVSSSVLLLSLTLISCISIDKATENEIWFVPALIIICISNVIIFKVYLKILDILLNFNKNKFKK